MMQAVKIGNDVWMYMGSCVGIDDVGILIFGWQAELGIVG